MTVNLPWPYTPTPSSPRSPEMAFYAPGQPDFLFQDSEQITIICQAMRRALDLKWALCRSGLIAPLRQGRGEINFDNSFTLRLNTADLTPGFYDVRVQISFGVGESVEGITAFGWRVWEEPLILVEPEGFASYWRRIAADLRRERLDLHSEYAFILRGGEIDAYNAERANLPERVDPDGEVCSEVEVYRVHFAAPGGGRVFGWLAKPIGDGPFPGLLVLPGAGNNPRPAPVEHARHGYAALDIQVQGFAVDAPEYPRLSEQLPDWFTSVEGYPHYAVYRNALRAVDALTAPPFVEETRLAVVGGSQGGRLAIVVAALDERVKAAVPALVHFSCCPYVRWREKRNALKDSGREGFSRGDVPDDPQTAIESYFDVVNFAPLARCPVLMNAGLIDPVSPPSGVLGVYRRLGGPKEIRVMPNLAHDWSPAFERYAWRWLDGVLSQERAEGKR